MSGTRQAILGTSRPARGSGGGPGVAEQMLEVQWCVSSTIVKSGSVPVRPTHGLGGAVGAALRPRPGRHRIASGPTATSSTDWSSSSDVAASHAATLSLSTRALSPPPWRYVVMMRCRRGPSPSGAAFLADQPFAAVFAYHRPAGAARAYGASCAECAHTVPHDPHRQDRPEVPGAVSSGPISRQPSHPRPRRGLVSCRSPPDDAQSPA